MDCFSAAVRLRTVRSTRIVREARLQGIAGQFSSVHHKGTPPTKLSTTQRCASKRFLNRVSSSEPRQVPRIVVLFIHRGTTQLDARPFHPLPWMRGAPAGFLEGNTSMFVILSARTEPPAEDNR